MEEFMPVWYTIHAFSDSRPENPYHKEQEAARNSAHASVHGNLYPLYFGLAPDDAVDDMADFLVEKGLCCGVKTSWFFLKALARAGRYDEVYRLIVNTGEHGWVNMIREGATTCFEAWGKEQKWNTSLCHPWASGPIRIMIEEIGGIVPDPESEGGYRKVPHISKHLEQFELQVPLRGKICISGAGFSNADLL